MCWHAFISIFYTLYNLTFLNRSAVAQLSFDFIIVRVDSSINFDLHRSRFVCTRESVLLFLFHSASSSHCVCLAQLPQFWVESTTRAAEIQMRCVQSNLIEVIYSIKCFTPKQKEFNDEKLTTTMPMSMLMMRRWRWWSQWWQYMYAVAVMIIAFIFFVFLFAAILCERV